MQPRQRRRTQLSAALGKAGVNGTATMTLAVAGTGTLAIALKAVAHSATFAVEIDKGSCTARGPRLVALPALKSTVAGTAARTSALTAAQVAMLDRTLSVRLIAGSTIICGLFVVKSDLVGPVGSVRIAKDAAETTTLAVTLNLTAADPSGATQMRLANTQADVKGDGVLFAATATWTLAGARGPAGPKTVFAQFKDAAGNWGSIVSDTISYPCTIEGTSGDDRINGTAGDDVICGNAGNDILVGLEGNDRLIGAEGDDSLYGRAGVDILEGGPGYNTAYWDGIGDLGRVVIDVPAGTATNVNGQDTFSNISEFWGTPLNDLFIGGPGDDHFYGSAGDDVAIGGGNDELFGNDGNDILDGGTGNNKIEGGNGTDTCTNGPTRRDVRGTINPQHYVKSDGLTPRNTTFKEPHDPGSVQDRPSPRRVACDSTAVARGRHP